MRNTNWMYMHAMTRNKSLHTNYTLSRKKFTRAYRPPQWELSTCVCRVRTNFDNSFVFVEFDWHLQLGDRWKRVTVMTTTYHMDMCTLWWTSLLVPEVPGSGVGIFFSVRPIIIRFVSFLQWVELGCGHSQLCSVAHWKLFSVLATLQSWEWG